MWKTVDTTEYRYEDHNPNTLDETLAKYVTDRNGTRFTIPAARSIVYGPPEPCRATQTGSWSFPPCSQQTGSYSWSVFTAANRVEDTNGNIVSLTASGVLDTVGRNLGSYAVDTLENCPGGSTRAELLSFPSVDDNPVTVRLCYAELHLQTNFNFASPSGQQILESGYTDPQSVLVAAILPNQTRWQFEYDSYGNITKVTLPTGGSITYTWRTVALCSSGWTPVSRAVESRIIDAGDGTPARMWRYQGELWPNARTAMADASGATSWTYDSMGRVLNEHRTIAGNVSDIGSDTYNLDGSVNTLTYPSGRIITYSYDTTGRPISVSQGGTTFVSIPTGGYAPSGAIWNATYGAAIGIANTYNSRLQPKTMSATAPPGTLLNRTYSFIDPVTQGNNGNVYQITDGLDSLNLANRPNGSVTFTYDQLNRIASVTTRGTDCSPRGNATRDYRNSFTIDPWGNLTQKTTTKCSAENVPITIGPFQQHFTAE